MAAKKNYGSILGMLFGGGPLGLFAFPAPLSGKANLPVK